LSLYFFLEIISTLSGIICVYLQTRENIKAWPFGILSVTLAVFIFYKEMLYSDFILHNIYIVLNIYGWWFWNKKNKNNSSISSSSIKLIRNTQLLFYLMAILILSFVWGNYMDKHFNASFPYLDAFTTIGSLIAQYLLARKILQNWLIWIAVDFVAIGVYLAKDLYFFSGLFTVYLILCIKGYLDWRKPLRYNHPKTA
jgi:nicotinamide mononucleotide transporter